MCSEPGVADEEMEEVYDASQGAQLMRSHAWRLVADRCGPATLPSGFGDRLVVNRFQLLGDQAPVVMGLHVAPASVPDLAAQRLASQ
jgi:hypothetical protein